MSPGDVLDLSGDVHAAGPPPWLRSRLERALDRLGTVPDPTGAVRAVAARHGRRPDEVLLTAGAAEAVVLVARALPPVRALCVQAASPDVPAALRASGHRVEEPVLAPPWELHPADVPDDVGLVVLGPAGPAGVLRHPVDALCRPGRVVVVDESLADVVPAPPEPLADRGDLVGLVVVRTLARTWALAGLPTGYLLAEAALAERLRAGQPAGTASTFALVALETCLARGPVRAAEQQAVALAERRDRLEQRLSGLGVEVAAGRGPFLLCRVPGRADVRGGLAERGVLVREGASGPAPGHWTVAVPDDDGAERLLDAVSEVLREPCAATDESGPPAASAP